MQNTRIPLPNNPRTWTETDRDRLAESMEKFGDLSGIVINVETGHFVGGHQRDKIANFELADRYDVQEHATPLADGTIETGYFEHEGHRFAYRLVSWTEEEEREALVLANKLGGQWDHEKTPLFADVVDLESIGFRPWEINPDYQVETTDDTTSPESRDRQTHSEGEYIKGDTKKVELIVTAHDLDLMHKILANTALQHETTREEAAIKILRHYVEFQAL